MFQDIAGLVIPSLYLIQFSPAHLIVGVFRMAFAIGFASDTFKRVQQITTFLDLVLTECKFHLYFQGIGNGRVDLFPVDRLLHYDGLINGSKRFIESA